MNKSLASVILILVMVAVIVTLDIVFFRHRFVARLIANVGIVLLFIAFYLIFIK